MPRQPKHTSTRPAAEADAVASVSLISLGCPKNLVDSEKMLGLLAQDGLLPVSYDPDNPDSFGGADAVVVNTCGFLEASKDESLQVIQEALRAKERGDVQRVIVAGCLVQRHRAKMLEWAPGIDAMIGVFDRDRIVEAVRGPVGQASRLSSPSSSPDAPRYWVAANALQAARARGVDTVGLTVQGKDGKGIGYFEDDSARLRLTPRHYAYLRISEGCNQNCAFCTIPSIRGKMRSKPVDRIVAEARELLNDGAFELLLIGQDTTSFGDDLGLGMGAAPSDARNPRTPGMSGSSSESRDRPPSFDRGLPLLLKSLSDAVEEHGSGGWVRLMYAYPSNFSRPIIDAFAELATRGRVAPYIDIPLQHASDRVLKSMRRHVTRARQEDVLLALRERVPGMAIRTTFISGFPGETEDDHAQLLGFVERMGFEAVGVFEYSKEAGTVAGTMEQDPALAVPAEVKARRRGEIMALQQRLAFARNARLAARFDASDPASGARVDVIIDHALRTRGQATTGVSTAGRLFQGRTIRQAPDIDAVTFVHSKDQLAPGELVRGVIVASEGYDLIARPVDEVQKRVALKVL
ncbi:MAG: 30S ribosomal protein S12 methylthiotransferase RimO [Phycisphaerae bacterium]|nr:30S ribosomal protein S12 methylthiotransferase RimO [Phycisphaerae bacterium]